jgi:hypothetical protein
VDEIPTDDSTADVISTSAAATASTFALESNASAGIDGTFQSALAVKVTTNARESAGITSSGNMVRLRRSSTIFNSTARDYGNTTFRRNSIVFQTDPSTSRAWMLGALDLIQPGINNVTAEGSALECANIVTQVVVSKAPPQMFPSVNVTEMDGFESGRTDQTRAVTGSPTIVSSPVYGGEYALRANSVASTDWVSYAPGRNDDGTDDTTAYDNVAVQFRVYLVSAPAGTTIIAELKGIQIRLTSGRNLQIHAGTPGSFVLALNTWYTLAFLVPFDQAPNHILHIYSADMSVLHETQLNAVASVAANTVDLGVKTSATMEIVYDDLLCSRAGTSLFIGTPDVVPFPIVVGNYKVRRKDVVANGTDTDWTGSYANVDENPTDDSGSDVAANPVTSGEATYALETNASAGIGGRIVAVKVTSNMRRTAAIGATDAIINRVRTTVAGLSLVEESAGDGLGALNTFVRCTYDPWVCPPNSFGRPFSLAELNTLEIGVASVDPTANEIELANIIAQVAFVDPAEPGLASRFKCFFNG